MIRSMTGFGRAEWQGDGFSLQIEAKSLNSKQFDLSLKIPGSLRPYEGMLRKQLQEALGRGKVEVYVQLQSGLTESNYRIDADVFRSYLQQLRELTEENGLTTDLAANILQLPDVLRQMEEQEPADLENIVQKVLDEAIEKLQSHRTEEGRELEKDLAQQLAGISARLDELPPFEEERNARLEERLKGHLAQLKGEVDEARYHQEVIYYLEKWDINEERVRLRSHLDLFAAEMEQNERQGRKLHFIAQEIGREVNTIGSKCQHAEMQKRVVQMKDHLEQIKEQLSNVL